jgi:excisionase family DNA binding protein
MRAGLRAMLAPEGRIALGPREAAAALGVSESWIRRAMKERGLPYSRVEGRVLIRRDDLLAWLERHRERPISLESLEAETRRVVDDVVAGVQRR